jgi:hypothetical protein
VTQFGPLRPEEEPGFLLDNALQIRIEVIRPLDAPPDKRKLGARHAVRAEIYRRAIGQGRLIIHDALDQMVLSLLDALEREGEFDA